MREKELRIALVCFGGISLAVYMHGISKEILKLVRASRALHAIVPRPPLLLATASTIDINVDALAEAGISELLRRPLASTELAAALARCLRTPATLQS